MKSEWKVQSNYLGSGNFTYQVCRVIYTGKTVYNGNLEYADGSYTADKQTAVEMAKRLNEEEKQND